MVRFASRRRAASLALMLLVLVLTVVLAPFAGAQEEPVVRAVLFFSPTCGHCEYVIQEYLLPVEFPGTGGDAEIYYDETLAPEDTAFYLVTNGRLEMIFADTSVLEGAELFGAATVAYGIPSPGVPRLIVGDQYLFGSADIPGLFPGIVADGLAAGIDWPDIDGMAEAVASIPVPGDNPDETITTLDPVTTTTAGTGETTTTAEPVTTTTDPTTTTTEPGFSTDESMWDRFGNDAAANTIAVIVLLGMLVALLWVARQLVGRTWSDAPLSTWIPALAVFGLGVAAYLLSVEAGGEGAEAVCGPVGNCNAVQGSDYARLFGLIHIGLIGVIGYVVASATWVAARFVSGRFVDWARVGLFGGTIGGVGFSIYLTFLEPFVIGATCLWCITSAVIITVLMLLSTRPAVAAWSRLRSPG